MDGLSFRERTREHAVCCLLWRRFAVRSLIGEAIQSVRVRVKPTKEPDRILARAFLKLHVLTLSKHVLLALKKSLD